MIVALCAGVAVACAGLVATVGIASWTVPDSRSVDDLPTVAEVVVAQAHRHGIQLPELTDDQRAALAADPVEVTEQAAFDQLSAQLLGVARLEGLDRALFLLGEVAAASSEAAGMFPRLFDDLLQAQPTDPAPMSPCR